METSKTINGIIFTSAPVSPINKLVNLPVNVPHVFISVESKPTKYGSYVAVVKNEDTDEKLRYYMPEYITKYAQPGKRFIYDGLKKKSDGTGYAYQHVMWA